MKRLIKSLLIRIPFSQKLLNAYYFYKFFNYLESLVSAKKFKNGDIEEIFTGHYKENFWENPESISGDGSTLEYTENIRKEIPKVLENFKIKRILDAPCGDYNWFRHIQRDESVSYVGGDVVADLVRRNNEKYENQNTKFLQLDITKDELPAADLWLCRDALFHFSNRDIFSTLNNFIESDIKYILTTSHTECKLNTDILTGQFRLLNLELPPFNFSKPILYIEDWIEGTPVRSLCLWEREQIKEALAKKKR